MRSVIKSEHALTCKLLMGFDRVSSSHRLLYEIVLMIFMVDAKYLDKIYVRISTEMKTSLLT